MLFSAPALAATRICSQTPAMLTVTCWMRGSSARVAASICFSNSTFSARLSTSSGFSPAYRRAGATALNACTLPFCPAREIERAATAACFNASAVIALL